MLPNEFLDILRCPACKSELEESNETLYCKDPSCHQNFPIVEGIPVLIYEPNSIFSIEDFVQKSSTTFQDSPSHFSNIVKKIIPSMIENYQAEQNFDKFVNLLDSSTKVPRILVVGGSILGQGFKKLMHSNLVQLLETDVSFGPRTQIICDAHDLPFAHGIFDVVIVQAVLEHVVYPERCVQEVHRVLSQHGVVYAETPFIQQVHMGRYDFTRFTELGHRMLFRHFLEIERGAVGGPGMALAWSYRYFLLSFTRNKTLRNLIKVFANFTSFYLKYFDKFLNKKSGAYDAASGYYFLGRKSDTPISDRKMLDEYRGCL